MAYSKLPLVCSDYILGLDDFNAACDSADAIKDAWAAKHGYLDFLPGADATPWRRAGKHNALHVARTAARVTVSTTATGEVEWTIEISGQGIERIERVGTGQWEIDLAGGVGQWVGTAQVDSSTASDVWRHVAYVSALTLFVTTYRLASGVFGATDGNFSFFVWGGGT